MMQSCDGSKLESNYSSNMNLHLFPLFISSELLITRSNVACVENPIIWLIETNGVVAPISSMFRRIVNNKKKRGGEDVIFTVAAAVVVPEKSGILGFACYAGLRHQEVARKIARLKTVARR
jgi:hypothetical protein